MTLSIKKKTRNEIDNREEIDEREEKNFTFECLETAITHNNILCIERNIA